jgi:hypothetical protein
MHERNENPGQIIFFERAIERLKYGETNVDSRIILKLILNKQVMRVRNGPTL